MTANSQPDDRNTCPFCAWLAGGAPMPPVVYENDAVIATLCELPISKGHVQIAFKRHYDELSKVDPADSARMGAAIPIISAAVKTGMAAEIIYVACICEEVRHVHFHLVPRYTGQTKGFTHFTGERIKLDDVEQTVDAIRRNIFANANERQ